MFQTGTVYRETSPLDSPYNVICSKKITNVGIIFLKNAIFLEIRAPKSVYIGQGVWIFDFWHQISLFFNLG